MRRILDLAALFGTIFVLMAIMLWLRDFEFAGDTLFHPKSLAATGFIVLAAFSMGEFFKLLNIPALLGYIAAGVLFGPNLGPMLPGQPEALFSSEVISNLALINVLTIGVIGTMGGGELKIEEIKQNLTTILAMFGAVFVIVWFATFGTVLIVADHFPQLLPFLDGLPRSHVYAAAGLFGVFGAAMSPAATLAILQETRAQGRVSSLILGTVIIADLTLVALVLLGIQLSSILISPEGFTAEALAASLPGIALEFGYGLLLGIVAGIVFISYLRFVKKELLLFTVFFIFVTAYIAQLLHAETLLAFLAAGFVVQNFSKQGHDMIHALEKISLPVFVIYFMTQAATLDLAAVADYIWITLLLAVMRLVAFYLGSRLAADATRSDPTVRRYLWLGFFSLAGVDLVLADMVGSALEPWGRDFQTVIMAQVIVHITIGPPLLKLGLDRAGETEGSRRETREEAEAFDMLPAMDEDAALTSFPEPMFEDEALNTRILELRQFIMELHAEYIVEPLAEKSELLTASLQDASEELAVALDQLHAVLSSDAYESADERAQAITTAHMQYLSAIADNVRVWEWLSPETVNRERLFELIARIRTQEEFATTYRVESEDFIYNPEPDDSTWVRGVKVWRRARRSIFGRGDRTIPLGRLWRYYIELTIPRLLVRAADASAIHNERFWSDLGNHMRRADDLFDAVFDAVVSPVPVPVGEQPEGEGEPVGEREPTEAESVLAALRVLEEGRAEVRAREEALTAQLNAAATTALDRYTVSLRETYTKFLHAAARAGTSELPTWRYRPSAQFDRSRRAEAQLDYRLRRERTVVTGHRGWIVTEYQLVLFLYWLELYETQIQETLSANIGHPIQGQFDVLRAICSTVPPELDDLGDLAEVRDAIGAPDAEEQAWPAIEWDLWLKETIRPALQRTRNNLQRMLTLYAKGQAARRLLDILERRVAEFSDEVVLLSEHPDELDPREVVPTRTIALREWFDSEVVRETALRLVEFDERGEALVRECLLALEDIQQVLEFNLLTAERDADDKTSLSSTEVATGGLERAVRMIEDLRDAHQQRFEELTQWFVAATSGIAERAAQPFLDHRLAEIERLMSRRGQTSLAERGENIVVALVNRGVSGVRGTYRRYVPIAQEVADEISALFVEEEAEVSNRHVRARLQSDPWETPTIPPIYRRLFTPVPLDIPDFYVPRIEVETEFNGAVREWIDGRRNSILVYGDRGAGKRSMVHSALRGDMDRADELEFVDLHTVVLDDDQETAEELLAQISSVFPGEAVETIEGLTRFLDVSETRHIVTIEHGEKLFSRTAEGLLTCRKLLRMMNDTSDTVLWIVLMGKPAVGFLDTAIGIFDYFTHPIEVGPVSNDSIEQMIQRRHRVSGFRASFARERPRIRDWIRHPIDTSDALRDPRSEFFRDLSRLSEGNPMRALLYWLEAVTVDPEDDHLLSVESLPDSEPHLVAGLTLPKRLILTALVQHRALTTMQLRAILRKDFDEVQSELDHLQRLGFVQQSPGRHAVAWQLRPSADGLVTHELRELNMI